MRARLALAQTLVPSPELLILDEPSDGLDPEGIHEIRQTILRLHRELKATILLSSHFLNEVEQVCTRIAVLKKGRKVFEGTLDEIRRRERWVRIRTVDIRATQDALQAAGIARPGPDAELIVLNDGSGPDTVAKFMVERGMPVFEISAAEQTLENFYLSLMGEKDPTTSS
jgi:ABC-2 type transport system ATP-binding protein